MVLREERRRTKKYAHSVKGNSTCKEGKEEGTGGRRKQGTL